MVDEIIIMSPTFNYDPKWQVLNELELPVYTCSTFDYRVIKKIHHHLIHLRNLNMHSLLVIDDMTRGVRTGDRAEQLLDRIIANNRWLNCTLIESVQKVVHAPTEMRLNWDCLITFYPDNIEELSLVYKTCGFGRKEDFDQLLRFCTKEPYSFLYIRRDGPVTHYFHKFVPLQLHLGEHEIK